MNFPAGWRKGAQLFSTAILLTIGLYSCNWGGEGGEAVFPLFEYHKFPSDLGLSFEIIPDKDQYKEGEQIQLTLRLTNQTVQGIELSYTRGNEFVVYIFNAQNQVVAAGYWNCIGEKCPAVITIIQNETILPGAFFERVGTVKKRLLSGTYTIRADSLVHPADGGIYMPVVIVP